MKKKLTEKLVKDLELSQPLSEDSYEITSPYDGTYNCFAWALCDYDCWWDPFDPDGYWPKEIDNDTKPDTVIKVYCTRGYSKCDDGIPDKHYQKIVFYGTEEEVKHVARLLLDGQWACKLGPAEDIVHKHAEDFQGKGYGNILFYMRRRRIYGDPQPPSDSKWPLPASSQPIA